MKQAKPCQYKKVRFYHPQLGPTAGLVVTVKQLQDLGLAGFSRLFPTSEIPKMKRLQMSPPYNTFEDAFNHQFDLQNMTRVKA